MDSHDDLNQLLQQLDSVKDRSRDYIQKNRKGEKEPQQSLSRLEKSFNHIVTILKTRSDPFLAEITKLKEGMRETPGHRVRPRGVTAIEGIGNVHADRLKIAGISTTTQLLDHGASPKGRKVLAQKTGIQPSLILKWINMADLFRVRGIGEEYASLLEDSGVDTVPELATRRPENLHAKLVEVNDEKRLVRQLPTLAQVDDWVQQAKDLERKITY